ncbi:hypothetical protein WJX75_006834 [Coccomyxa subellipsoidea]|uniref:Uncharacterized protein n=1 Tax=Coccomyxa subellipsoidea TaxID=248742 RepID=A0ABR2YCB3_9CHLO
MTWNYGFGLAKLGKASLAYGIRACHVNFFSFQITGSKMASKTRVAVCLLFAIALLASSATATATSTLEGDNVAALPLVLPVVNLGRKLASDGGSKAGPPPVKCTYAKGPKGINKVCT